MITAVEWFASDAATRGLLGRLLEDWHNLLDITLFTVTRAVIVSGLFVSQLSEDILQQGLEGNELVSLLTWINDYSYVDQLLLQCKTKSDSRL